MSTQIGFTDEEKKFWRCSTCENHLADCECGTKQQVAEIDELQEIFGVSTNPADIKLVPNSKKVRIETSVLMLWDDNLYELKELGFEITYLQANQHAKHIVEIRRIYN